MGQNSTKNNQKDVDEDYCRISKLEIIRYKSDEIVKNGFLWKRGKGKIGNAWKYRWFTLSAKRKLIHYFKKKEDLKPVGCIQFRGYKVECYDDKLKSNTFKLIPDYHKKRTWYLAADSIDERNSWINIIQTALDNQKINQMDHLKLSTIEIMEQNFENLNISPENIEWTDKILGKGGSGVVQKGLLYKTTEIAIKSINNVAEFISEEEQRDFYHEIEMLSNLRHPNIVSMMGFCIKDKKIYLITEFVDGGTLSDIIYNKKIKIEIPLQLEILISLTKGMVYIHSKKVIHRDLKPSNILVENLSLAKIKICDFGVSKMSDLIKTTKNVGTLGYSAPELITTHSNKVDVYSFAIIAWEIYNRKRAWEDIKIPWELSKLVAHGKRPFLEANCPFYEVITKSWSGNPAERPTFNELFEQLNQLKNTLGTEVSVSQKMFEYLKKKSPISWKEFSNVFCKEIKIKDSKEIEPLKPILTDQHENITLDMWKEFLKWFSPIIKSSSYANKGGQSLSINGWLLNQILDIVGQSWFFGFLSTNDAKFILSTKVPGSFLFRFSNSQPGMYTLSVVGLKAEVYHWRINCEKNQMNPIFKIDNESYPNLLDITVRHAQIPLINSENQNVKLLLLEPCDRNRDLMLLRKHIYNN